MEEKLIIGQHPFISVTGGGGKTTFLVEFGRYLRQRGKKVLMTTTTKLASPEREKYWEDDFITYALPPSSSGGSLTLFAIRNEELNKLVAPEEKAIAEASAMYDVTLCEADGSRHLPFKIHTSRDPVIHPLTTAVVSVTGLWGIGQMTGKAAFGERCERVIDSAYLDDYLSSPEGPCKGMTAKSRNILLFNGGDDMSAETEKIISSVSIPSCVDEAYIVSERRGEIYNAL